METFTTSLIPARVCGGIIDGLHQCQSFGCVDNRARKETTLNDVDLNALEASSKYVHARTVSFIDDSSSGRILASGVLIQICHRLLIASAAHTIPSLPNEKL